MQQKKSRRAFIEWGLKRGIALPLVLASWSSCQLEKEEATNTAADTKPSPLKILILGGTSFLGPHQIAYAMERGHTITTFTRGKTQPSIHKELFEKVEQLIGDRKDNLTALHNRKWDVVIDNSGRDVEWTKSSATLLKDNCELYLYTSSTGVYYPYLKSYPTEEDKVLLEEPTDINDEETKIEYWYGVMKANSELAAIEQFGKDRTIVVRPTYMIGPADKTNRFIHWPIRLSQGGEVLLPGKAEDRVQYIDVRDVAEWMIRLIEDKKAGTYNAVGPKENQTMYDFAEAAKEAFDANTRFVKIDDYEFLKKQKVHYIVPWIMPTDNNRYSAEISNQKAKVNGLNFRPLTESIKDIYNWWNSDAVSPAQREEVESNPKSVLAREQTIIEAWKVLQPTKF